MASDETDSEVGASEERTAGHEGNKKLLHVSYGGLWTAGAAAGGSRGVTNPKNNDLDHHPQASSRVLSKQEQRAGLGSFSHLPAELQELVWDAGSLHDWTVVARTSRALNERVLPLIMRDVEATASRSLGALCNVVDRLYRLDRLVIRSLVVHERDTAMPPQFLDPALGQMASTLERLVWYGGYHATPPQLPALLLASHLELDWLGSLHMWDDDESSFFGKLLANGTTGLHTIKISVHKGSDDREYVSDIRRRVFGSTHVLSLGKVFSSQRGLTSFRILDFDGSSFQDRATSLSLLEDAASAPQLRVLSIFGRHFDISPACGGRLLAAASRLETLLFGPNLRGADELPVQQIKSLRHLGADESTTLALLAPALSAPGQLKSVGVIRGVTFPSNELQQVLRCKPRRFESRVALASRAGVEHALVSILSAHPELQSLKLMFDAPLDAVPRPAEHWTTVFQSLIPLAVNLRSLYLEVTEEVITPPASVDPPWAEELFGNLPPQLERFSVGGDIVQNAPRCECHDKAIIKIDFRFERNDTSPRTTIYRTAIC